MAYTVDSTNSDFYDPISVEDGSVNTETQLKLVGKNYIGYGEAIAENFLHLLEHFASDSEPNTATARVGQLYFNTTNENFYYFDGTEWKFITLSTVAPMTVQDNATVDHVVTAIHDEGNIIALVSSEDFTVHASDPVYSQFPTVGNGITLASGAKFHGTATSAQYADLAEMYVADAEYAPGTVLKIGGEAEVTQTTEALCTQVFGIVSSEPAYLMNSTLCSENDCIAVSVALAGRLPCRVIGPVKKGDRLVSSEEPGVARVASIHEAQDAGDWNRVIGRALADKTTESIDLVEIVVGAK